MDVIERLTNQGKYLGYEGETLQTFVKEQQIELRDERKAMREAKNAKHEAEAKIEHERCKAENAKREAKAKIEHEKHEVEHERREAEAKFERERHEAEANLEREKLELMEKIEAQKCYAVKEAYEAETAKPEAKDLS